MESEETGEENRGTSEEYGPRRRTSGKQALHFWKNYTLVVFALTLVYVCTTILYVSDNLTTLD
jgi:hypothetical protein